MATLSLAASNQSLKIIVEKNVNLHCKSLLSGRNQLLTFLMRVLPLLSPLLSGHEAPGFIL